MKESIRKKVYITLTLMTMLIFAACSSGNETKTAPAEPAVTPTPVQEVKEEAKADTKPANEKTDASDGERKIVDVMFFMGQSNMCGCGGDASLAPKVSEEAGMEFRAYSDPTRLYPIEEPFGVNENNPEGIGDVPGVKNGSLVSSFVNKYHELTNRQVIAVSIAKGESTVGMWLSNAMKDDLKDRYDKTLSYLKDNGYEAEHIYVIWLQGESDGLEKKSADTYRTQLNDLMRPLFESGLEKVFIITPGRMIDFNEIFVDIIKAQEELSTESEYYALATTVLTGVSPEYMKDQYHYNQHVLNMTGQLAAQSVAYYTLNGKELIVYDYRPGEGEYIVPEGADPDKDEKEDKIDLSNTNINEKY